MLHGEFRDSKVHCSAEVGLRCSFLRVLTWVKRRECDTCFRLFDRERASDTWCHNNVSVGRLQLIISKSGSTRTHRVTCCGESVLSRNVTQTLAEPCELSSAEREGGVPSFRLERIAVTARGPLLVEVAVEGLVSKAPG
jgi:hypothetical protein